MKLLFACFFLYTFIQASTLQKAQEAEENKEYQKAFNYYQDVSKNNAIALFKLGTYYYKGKVVKKNYLKAKQYFEKASFLGYEKATYNLGILYSNKKASFHDYNKAYNIFLGLAKDEHAPSQNRIAMFLTFGISGIEKNYKEAVTWYEKSAKQGYVNAQCNLAFMYASGKGVWQNMGRAHAFAKPGYEKNNRLCKKVWKDFNLAKYPEDKGWKFKFYNKP